MCENIHYTFWFFLIFSAAIGLMPFSTGNMEQPMNLRTCMLSYVPSREPSHISPGEVGKVIESNGKEISWFPAGYIYIYKYDMGVSNNRGTPKWMVCNGKPFKNGWLGGTTIFGNIHLGFILPPIYPSIDPTQSSLGSLSHFHPIVVGACDIHLRCSDPWVFFRFHITQKFLPQKWCVGKNNTNTRCFKVTKLHPL